MLEHLFYTNTIHRLGKYLYTYTKDKETRFSNKYDFCTNVNSIVHCLFIKYFGIQELILSIL